jgi:baculoviral IAP repeat-containing protein 2/3
VGWSSPLSAEEVASAGFYFVGVGDRVKCFSCGVGLNNWGRKDIAWREHARYSPKCGFVKKIKGRDFVAKCKQEHLDLLLEKYLKVSTGLPLVLPPFVVQSTDFIMKSPEVMFCLASGIPKNLVEKILKRFMLENGRGFVSKDEISKVLSVSLSFDD